ncbi:MAG: nucleotide exchange factor GrpE, partial [Planctomycetota bacterium]
PYLLMLDMAITHCKNTDNTKAIQEGIELLSDEFKKILREEGLQEIEPQNELFDPFLAEAVDIVETENADEDNKIAEVVSKGYKFKNIVIVPAKVKIKKVKKNIEENEPV